MTTTKKVTPQPKLKTLTSKFATSEKNLKPMHEDLSSKFKPPKEKSVAKEEEE